MEDSRWSKLIIIGIVLAVLTGLYFLLTNKFIFNKPKNSANSQIHQTAQPQSTNNTPEGVVLSTDTAAGGNSGNPQVVEPGSKSAYETITTRNQQKVTVLPSTGFPVYLISAASLSAIVMGLSLRKFPN